MAVIWQDDAREFGLHIKQGGWRLGLLVARNVAPGAGTGGGGTDGSHRSNRNGEKVSARSFAEEAGTGPARVLRYLTGWEKAAGTGTVPHAADLNPDSEPALDVETLPEWEDFYSSPVGRNVGDDRQGALRRQAKADGVGPSKVVDVASNPKAMASAIQADSAVAEVATEALTGTLQSAQQTYKAARKALIEQGRDEGTLPPAEEPEPKQERILRIEQFCDDTIRLLAEVLDEDTDPTGQRSRSLSTTSMHSASSAVSASRVPS